MVNRYAAEHIIINGKDNIEPWINRYFVPEEEYQQLEAENVRLKAEVDKLREWQQIILGTGTDREAVIRMAATKYTEIAVQSWRDKLKAELAQCHADKDEMVKRNKLLRDRPDLPLERLAAYDEIMNQLAQATQRNARLREAFKGAYIQGFEAGCRAGLEAAKKNYADLCAEDWNYKSSWELHGEWLTEQVKERLYLNRDQFTMSNLTMKDEEDTLP